MNSNRRYLITGGAGFIGSHLAGLLLERGARVDLLDDLSTGSIENIAHLTGDPALTFTEGSVTDASLVRELAAQADGIFHLAAAVGVQLVFREPTRTIQTNIRGAEIVLEAAAELKRRVFIASTSEVYGKGITIPLEETSDLLLGPTTCARWSYACSKAIDEFLALAYHKEQGLPVVIGRFFNTVGPRQTGRYGMVIPRFIHQALKGEPLTVYGDGNQSRCFGYVGDVARAVADLIENPAAVGEVFNIGHDEEITIIELARRIIAMTGSASEIRHVAFEEAFGPGFEEMERRVPKLDKLRSIIRWDKLKSTDEILDVTIKSMR